jgi:biopolymer transport protein ExbD
MRTKKEFFSSIPGEESLINLTPLIDVVFVVLVAFILIAPLVEVDNVDLAPASILSTKEINQEGSLQIYVRADETIWLKKRLVSEKELASLLKESKSKGFKHVILYQDKKATFGSYQTVKNSVEEAGFSSMDVILQPH